MFHRKELLSTEDAAGKSSKLQENVWKEGDRSIKRWSWSTNVWRKPREKDCT